MKVLETQHVKKSFVEGTVHVDAVRGVDIAIGEREMVAIIGRSGSGKSTLLCLLGAIETPTSGKVLLEGVDMATLNDDERTLIRRRRIGFVFQAFNLIPTLTAVENVALPLELDGLPEATARERAAKALELVDLRPRMDHLPNMMSGGEQQRVAVARALVIQPALVLADEPTGNLDSAGSRQVITLLRDLVDNQGMTVVIVTHDMQVAAQADRIIRIHDGLVKSEEVPSRPLAGALTASEVS
jgi:putative ABC transport system ATP-binding protein